MMIHFLKDMTVKLTDQHMFLLFEFSYKCTPSTSAFLTYKSNVSEFGGYVGTYKLSLLFFSSKWRW